MKLHEVVLHAPCLSACLPLLCSSVTGPSLICLSAVALFVCRWSIVGLSLVYHWSVTGLLGSWLLSCHWSARVVVAVLSLVCLLGSWPLVRVANRAPLVRHSCATRASLVCLFLILLVCWSSVTDLSARVMVTGPSVVCRSFTPRPSDRPSLLVCLLLCRCSACLSITGCRCHVPVQGHRSVAHPSARASLVRLLVVGLPLVCLLESWSLVRGSCIARPSTGVVAALSLGSTWHCVRFCWTVRLFDCSVLHSARLDFVLLGCSTLLALCAFLFYLLVEFGRHPVHTLCPTREVPSIGLSLIRCPMFWSPSSVVVVRSVVITASRVFRYEECMHEVREWIVRLRRQFPWLL